MAVSGYWQNALGYGTHNDEYCIKSVSDNWDLALIIANIGWRT